MVSQLKSDLLNKNTIITQDGFDRIQDKVRTLIGVPDLQFGLAAFSEFDSILNQQVIWKSIIPQSELKCDEYVGTLYEKAYQSKDIVLTDDLRKLKKIKRLIFSLQREYKVTRLSLLFCIKKLLA